MAMFVKCHRDASIVPMFIAGDGRRCCAQSVIWALIQSSDALKGFDLSDFNFTPRDAVVFDPGGACWDVPDQFIINISERKYEFREQFLLEALLIFHPENQLNERVPGWYRIGQPFGFCLVPVNHREPIFNALRVRGLTKLEKLKHELEAARIDQKIYVQAGAGAQMQQDKEFRVKSLEAEVHDFTSILLD